MSIPKAVLIIGHKNTGKTRVVEAIVRELSERGYRVGTLKHSIEDTPFDTPGKDTWRHTQAGASATAIINPRKTAIFRQDSMRLEEAVEHLGDMEFIVIEGFKSNNTTARIIVPSKQDDLEKLGNGLEIAVAPTKPMELNTDLPIYHLEEADKLVDILLSKAFPLLPGIDCKGCGYENCRQLAEAIMSGEANAIQCVEYATKPVTVEVNEKDIPINPFIQELFRNVLTGLVKTLKGGETPRSIEIRYRVDPDG
jgi:molybdopterin-guanine dinucleotide biosynthesis protein B